MFDLNDLATRYVAVWNEPDAELRRKAIAELFTSDVLHFSPTQAVRGHGEMEERIGTSYDRWIAPGEFVFRARPGANGHHDAVRFSWEMINAATGAVNSVGSDFVTMTEDGLIRTDYQFVDA